MHFEAIEGRLNSAESQDLQEHNNWAVHNTDATAETLFTAVLHLAPDFLGGDTLNHQRILDDIRNHIVNKIKIDVATLQTSNGLLKSILDVITVSDPQFANYVKVFTLA